MAPFRFGIDDAALAYLQGLDQSEICKVCEGHSIHASTDATTYQDQRSPEARDGFRKLGCEVNARTRAANRAIVRAILLEDLKTESVKKGIASRLSREFSKKMKAWTSISTRDVSVSSSSAGQTLVQKQVESAAAINKTINEMLHVPITATSKNSKGPKGFPLGIENAMDEFAKGLHSTKQMLSDLVPAPLQTKMRALNPFEPWPVHVEVPPAWTASDYTKIVNTNVNDFDEEDASAERHASATDAVADIDNTIAAPHTAVSVAAETPSIEDAAVLRPVASSVTIAASLSETSEAAASADVADPSVETPPNGSPVVAITPVATSFNEIDSDQDSVSEAFSVFENPRPAPSPRCYSSRWSADSSAEQRSTTASAADQDVALDDPDVQFQTNVATGHPTPAGPSASDEAEIQPAPILPSEHNDPVVNRDVQLQTILASSHPTPAGPSAMDDEILPAPLSSENDDGAKKSADFNDPLSAPLTYAPNNMDIVHPVLKETMDKDGLAKLPRPVNASAMVDPRWWTSINNLGQQDPFIDIEGNFRLRNDPMSMQNYARITEELFEVKRIGTDDDENKESVSGAWVRGPVEKRPFRGSTFSKGYPMKTKTSVLKSTKTRVRPTQERVKTKKVGRNTLYSNSLDNAIEQENREVMTALLDGLKTGARRRGLGKLKKMLKAGTKRVVDLID